MIRIFPIYRKTFGMKLVGLVVAMCVSSPVLSSSQNASEAFSNAEKLIQLDTMLMAMSKRCSLVKEPFNIEYSAFHRSFKNLIEQSSKIIQSEYQKRHERSSLDSMLTATANSYGGGHPIYSCEQLKGEVARLSKIRSEQELQLAMHPLLSGAPKHDHSPDSLAILAPEGVPAPTARQARESAIQRQSEPSPDQSNSTQQPSKQIKNSSNGVRTGIAKDYTGGGLIKDF